MNLHCFLNASPKEIFNTFISKACDLNLEFVYKNNMYLWIKGNTSIALTSHVDTVDYDWTLAYTDIDGIPEPNVEPKVIHEHNGIITATRNGHRCILGGDDRVGVHICYESLKRDKVPHIFLFNGEEFGGVGSLSFVDDALDLSQIQMMIALDACYNNEFVWYGENRSMDEWVESFGWKNRGRGIFTDIFNIGNYYDFPCVNLGVGYFNQHSEKEYIDIEIMELSKRKLNRMLDCWDEKIIPTSI